MKTLTPEQERNKHRAQAGLTAWRQGHIAAAIATSDLPMAPTSVAGLTQGELNQALQMAASKLKGIK